VGQKNKPLGILVQPPDRKYPLAVLDVRDDIIPNVLFGGGGNSHRFVQGNKNHILYRAGLQPVSIDLDPVAWKDLVADDRLPVVGIYHPPLNEPVGFASGTKSRITDEFI